jgi:hypothetical protein
MRPSISHAIAMCLSALSLLTTPTAFAQKPTSVPATPPATTPTNLPDQATIDAAIQAAEDRGALLFRLDRAAWVTTDVLRARWRNRPGVTLAGWVVEETDDTRLVTFLGQTTGGLIAVARFSERNGRVVQRNLNLSTADSELTPNQRSLARALQGARAFAASRQGSQAGVRSCASAPLNSIVIPTPNATGGHDVYLMTPWVERHTYPMGGHYRLNVGSDDTVALDRSFTTSCLQIQAGVPNRPDIRPESLIVSHILDPQPTEIHVFAHYTIGVPITVVIEDRIFNIARGQIEME